MKPIQLPLGINIQDQCTFDNFYFGTNLNLLDQLTEFLERDDFACLTLWGGTQVGKSHCLQAACQQYADYSFSICYFPLSQFKDDSAHFLPEILLGLESMDLVCLDDIDLVLGDEEWEKALFLLFNQLRDNKSKLLLTANNNIDYLNIDLPDLRSRLKWDSVLQIKALTDKGKISALQLRCKNRGIELPLDSAEFMLKRSEREMGSLYKSIDDLIANAIIESRRLTIPFIKEQLKF